MLMTRVKISAFAQVTLARVGIDAADDGNKEDPVSSKDAGCEIFTTGSCLATNRPANSALAFTPDQGNRL